VAQRYKWKHNTKYHFFSNILHSLFYTKVIKTQSAWVILIHLLTRQLQDYAISDGGMINECRAICGMPLGKGNQSTWRKHHPVPFCPPQISHDLMQDWTWAAIVGSQWLMACTMAWPLGAGITAILHILVRHGNKQNKLCGLSPQASYTDRVTAAYQRNGSPQPYSRFSRPEPLLLLPSSSSIVLTRLSGPRSRPTTSQKIW
jgi:hypothetical protein